MTKFSSSIQETSRPNWLSCYKFKGIVKLIEGSKIRFTSCWIVSVIQSNVRSSNQFICLLHKMSSASTFLRLMALHILLNFCYGKLSRPEEILFDTVSRKVNDDLVLAVNEHIDKVLVKNHKTVNIVVASKHHDESSKNELISGILLKPRDGFSVWIYDFNTISGVKNRRKRQMIFVLDDIESFRQLASKLDSNKFLFSGLYVFVMLHETNLNEVQEMFKTLWSLYIFNANVLIHNSGTVTVMTFQPFSDGSKCENHEPLEIASVRNGSFESFGPIFPEKFKNLKNCPMKVLTFEDGNAVKRVKSSNGNYNYRGYDIELLNALAKSLNFKIDLKFLQGVQPWGFVTANGTATGALAEVASKKNNIAIGNYFLRLNRLQVLDASVTYFSIPSMFVVPPGIHFTAFEKLLQPFESLVWFLILLAFSLGISSIILLNTKTSLKIQNFVYGTGVRQPMSNMMMVIFGITQPKLPRRNFARFILSMFLIFCLVQRSIYQGSLYIFLQSDGRHRIVSSVSEIVENDFQIHVFESVAESLQSQPEIYKRWDVLKL